MIEALVLAIALSMDAFAVSVGLGTQAKKNNAALKINATDRLSLPLITGLYFGVLHVTMPFIGYLVGASVFSWIEVYAPIIAFILLAFIGGKMVFESLSKDTKNDIDNISHPIMFLLAIATSIDAIAAGFSLTLLNVNPIIACALIGLATFVFSWMGVLIGAKSGTFLKDKAVLLGGIVLILIGVKILMS